MAALLSLPMDAARAQIPELQTGARVRLRAPSTVAGRVTGVVLARSADSVTLAREGGVPVAVPLSALTSLEVSRGKSRSRGAGKGALWGGGVMMLTGAAFSDRPCKRDEGAGTCEQVSAAENALYSGVAGVMIGAIIGAAVGSEHWVRATLPRSVAVAVAPTVRGVHVAVRLSPARR
jgi:hypothetical protein